MTHSHLADFDHVSRDREQVVKIRRRMIPDVHLRHDQHLARILDRFVIVADTAQHLDATTLKVIEIVGVVNASLSVRFLVSDAKLELVMQRRSGGQIQESLAY